MRACAVLVALLALSAAFAGCVGPAEGPPANQTQVRPTFSGELPDGRGRGSAYAETNATEEGAGGLAHHHDYWQGKDKITIVETVAQFWVLPPFPDGEGSSPRSMATVKVPVGHLVYEGTSKVEVLVTAPGLGYASPPTGHPSLSLTLRYRSAADSDFVDAGPVTLDTPLVIPVEPKMTDMPHSVTSLWAFRLVTDRPEYANVNVTITIHRGAQIKEWPGHPDLYADTEARTVMDQEVTHKNRGYFYSTFYGPQKGWVRPEKLISHGTGWIDVYLNVTRFQASNGGELGKLYLNVHNATLLGDETSGWAILQDHARGADYNGNPSYHFRLNVTDYGMDGPYQETSRWGFRPQVTVKQTAVFLNVEDWELTYDIKVVAHKRPPPPPEEPAPEANATPTAPTRK